MAKEYIDQAVSDKVEDDEELYRRILDRPGTTFKIAGEQLKVSRSAFDDSSEFKPSVNRANLCARIPTFTQTHPSQGVVLLIAKQIRAEPVSALNETEQIMYDLDVVADPIFEPIAEKNIAHALIVPSPPYRSAGNFRKVRERLAYIANENIAKRNGWLIYPQSQRN